MIVTAQIRLAWPGEVGEAAAAAAAAFRGIRTPLIKLAACRWNVFIFHHRGVKCSLTPVFARQEVISEETSVQIRE